jgi:hypothetical protein
MPHRRIDPRQRRSVFIICWLISGTQRVAGLAPHHLHAEHGMNALVRGERGGHARETASSPSAVRRRWIHVAVETAGKGDAGTCGPAAAMEADAAADASTIEEDASAGDSAARDPPRRARAH